MEDGVVSGLGAGLESQCNFVFDFFGDDFMVALW